MKLTVALLAGLLLLFGGLADAQAGKMDIGLTVDGVVDADTIWINDSCTFDFYYENSDTLGGYSTGFRIWSDNGVEWAYDTAILRIDWVSGMPPDPMVFDTTWAIISMVEGSRQYPVGKYWDQSFDINAADTTGADGLDSIMWGGTRKNYGLYPGPLERQGLIHFHATSGHGGTLCIDSNKVGEAGDFIFIDIAGSTHAPEVLWPQGGRCWPVKEEGQPVPPTIELNPTELNVQGEVGSTIPSEQISISNTGGGTLNWLAGTFLCSTWVSVYPPSGSGDGALTVVFDIAGLGEGHYEDTIIVSDPNATNSPQKAPVHLTLTTEPVDDTVYVETVSVIAGEQAVVEINYVNFAQNAGFFMPLTFSGTNINCDSVSFVGSRFEYMEINDATIDNVNDTIVIEAAPVLDPFLDPGSGLLAKLYFSTDLAAPTQFVPIDSSNGDFHFSDINGATLPTHYIPGGINIEAVQPRLVLSEASFDFGNVCKGDIVSDSFNITNDSTGILEWTAAADAGIELPVGNGTAPYTMNFSVNTDQLASGQQHALEITITAEGALNSPQTVTVNLFVVDCAECTFDIAEVNGHQGFPVPVPIYAYNDTTFAALQFYIRYDPSILRYDSIASGYMQGPTIGFPGDTIAYIWEDIPNPVSVPSGGTIMTIWFTSIGAIGQVSALQWVGENELVDPLGDPIFGLGFCDGSVTVVEPVYDVTGKIVYYDMARNVPDITVDLTGDTTATVYTDDHGDYFFEDLLAGNYTITPSRDDDDLGVSIADAVKIRRHLAFIEIFDSPYKMIAGDVSGDDRVSVADVVKIRLYLAKIETEFTVGTWAFVDSDFAITMENWFDAPRSIDITIVNSDVTVQDFIAVRIGDVNNSWSAVKDGSMKPTAGSPVKIDLPDIYGDIGDVVTMPIEISNASELAGIELHLGYDAHGLTVININSDVLSEMTVNTVDETIHLVWEDFKNPATIPGKQTIATVSFLIPDNFHASAEIDITGAEVVNAVGSAYPLELSGGYLFEGTDGNDATLPTAYALDQNVPNPFNPYTTIRATMKEAGEYSLTIFNIVGEKIKEYRGYQETGAIEFVWDGRNENGNPVASGIFLYRFKAADFSQTRKMVLIK